MGVVTRHGISPIGAYDAEVLSRYPIGSEVECRLHQPKTPRLSGKFWAILGRVVDNTDAFPDTRSLANALLIHCGYIESTSLIGGGEHLHPRSISDLQKAEFEQFFEEAMDVICTQIIPGLDRDALLAKEHRFVVRST
ncbi:MAG: hypothetical protein EA385_15260 [Salinarimonadaceae bacterium]|nr:MAG: hypothetical protein EA385_15260 [Salinarimonadaceae bacterium]